MYGWTWRTLHDYATSLGANLVMTAGAGTSCITLALKPFPGYDQGKEALEKVAKFGSLYGAGAGKIKELVDKASQGMIVEGGFVSGSIQHAGAVTGQLPTLKEGQTHKADYGFTVPGMKEAEEKLLTLDAKLEALEKVEAASHDLHQVIGKASPHKAHKPGSALTLLSKKP